MNVYVRRSGVVDNTIVNKNSQEYLNDQVLQQFRSNDRLIFFLPLPGRDSLTYDHLKHIADFSAEVEELSWAQETINGRTTSRVAGPTTIPIVSRGRDEAGNEIWNPNYDPALSEGDLWELENNDLYLKEWIAFVSANDSYRGKIFGENFEWAIVAVLLAPDHSQHEVYWDSVELLEGKPTSTLWRYFKNTITPKEQWQHWQVAGWAAARETLDISLTHDVVTIIPFGLILAFLAGVFLLGSWRRSLVMVMLMLCVLVWTRGSISVIAFLSEWLNFHASWLPTTENSYILVAASIWLVQGSSFTIHRFHAFNRASTGRKSTAQAWKDSAKDIGPILNGILVISVLTLVSLVTFEVRVIRELGPLAALGIVYTYVLAMYVLPQLHMRMCSTEAAKELPNDLLSFSAGTPLERAVNFVLDLVDELDEKLVTSRTALAAISVLTIGIIAIASAFVLQDRVVVNTQSLAFLKGTGMHQTMEWLNEEGKPGNDAAEVGIKIDLAPGDDLEASEILRKRNSDKGYENFRRVVRFIESVEALPGTTETSSIVDVIRDQNEGGIPEDAGALRASILAIEQSVGYQEYEGVVNPILVDNLRILNKPDSLSTEMIKVSVFTNQAFESRALSAFIGEIHTLTETHGLTTYPGGKTVNWALQEQQIRDGKIKNTILDFALVLIWAAAIARVFDRKRKETPAIRWHIVGAILVIPLLFASAVIVIALVTLGIDFNQAVAVIMAFAINASADFMLFPVESFIDSYHGTGDRRKAALSALDESGSVGMKDAAINALLFAPLMFARFEPIQQLGMIMVVMLAATAFAVRIIIPCFLVFSAKKT